MQTYLLMKFNFISIAAVAMAERVANERGEKVGQTVGFQIRLESRVSPKTLLTFCTNGVLLRTLMGSGHNNPCLGSFNQSENTCSLSSVTHIIIDEVHERDRFSDFLLIVLRDALLTYTSLKLVIMSATMDVDKFMKYFVNAHHISVPGRLYPVQEYYLEDILVQTGYSTPAMEKEKKRLLNSNKILPKQNKDVHQFSIHEELMDETVQSDRLQCETKESSNCEDSEPKNVDIFKEELADNLNDDVVIDLDSKSKMELDNLLSESFMKQSDNAFEQLMNLILNDDKMFIPIDYQHSETGVNALMCAAALGKIEFIEELLINNADTSLKAKNGWTAQEFAIEMQKEVAADIIGSFHKAVSSLVIDSNQDRHVLTDEGKMDTDFVSADISEEYLSSKINKLGMHNFQNLFEERELTTEQQVVLKAYQKTFDEDSEKSVDKCLIVALVKYIIQAMQNESQGNCNGSILIFLPGYEDIIGVHDLLKDDRSLLILMLHSQMVSLDQRKIFRPPPCGLTKVILSTNIAETSITIDDVRYVIDAGKVKEKSYDSLSGVTMLRMTWISKDSAKQRQGRAGRTQPGVCFRLFSSMRYSSLLQNTVPEILRTPLMELCLATKLLAPFGTPIAEFLSRAPDPPPFSSTRMAVQNLKQIEAIDLWEDVTEVGNHLLDLPIEPRLGKMVLYSVVLKCLDPILTIVCCISYKDPFILSSNPGLKKAVKQARQAFSESSMSDHMVLLRVFQGWQKARVDGNERYFCHSYQVSSSTMEMIEGIRTQLLGQLRASGFVRAKGYGDIRDLNRNSENWAVVKAALVGGSYPNVARYDKESNQLRTEKENKVRLNPHSILLLSTPSDNYSKKSTSSMSNRRAMEQIATDWFIFDDMSRAGRLALVRGVTMVSPIAIALFAGPIREQTSTLDSEKMIEDEDSESEADEKADGNTGVLEIDEWIKFRSEPNLVNLIHQMRQKWNALFLRRLQCAGKPMTQVDDSTVQTLVNILIAEEISIGLNQPVGIGQRPKAIQRPESMNSSSYSPRKSNNRFGATSHAPTYTMYKEKPPASSRSESISQPSSVISEQRPNHSNRKETPENFDCSTKYFVIKATNANALEFSSSKGLWQFGNQTERRLIKEVKAGFSIILIFSVQGSSHFQGFALFSGRACKERYSELQTQGQGTGSGTQYFIDWIKKGDVPFQATKNLINLYNDKKKVQTSRDGQELDPALGNDLCKLWNRVPNYNTGKGSFEAMRNENIGRYDNRNCNQKSYRKTAHRYAGRPNK